MALRTQSFKRFAVNVNSQIRHYSAPGEAAIPPAKAKYVPSSGTYPKGFLASSAHVGVKASNTKFDDLALIASEIPCAGAAVFTKNKFQAAPVTVTRDMLQRRRGNGVRSVVVNSGCANAVTGKGGIEDAVRMGEETDKLFDENYNSDDNGSRTMVMSTGVIGQRYASSIDSARGRMYSNHLQATPQENYTQDTHSLC
jgi:glutamate N-acetyltransferase/amino-acid N-acetyltransferase